MQKTNQSEEIEDICVSRKEAEVDANTEDILEASIQIIKYIKMNKEKLLTADINIRTESQRKLKSKSEKKQVYRYFNSELFDLSQKTKSTVD